MNDIFQQGGTIRGVHTHENLTKSRLTSDYTFAEDPPILGGHATTMICHDDMLPYNAIAAYCIDTLA